MEKKWLERLDGIFDLEKLERSKVFIAGLGGVGSWAVEAIARSGVGEISILDGDIVDETNINRQLVATTLTVGRRKVDVMEERIKAINPDCKVKKIFSYLRRDSLVDLLGYDYIVDAIDFVEAKVLLIEEAKNLNIPIISSMGMAKKVDPTLIRVAPVEETSVCPLAKAMRAALKTKNIKNVPCVYSLEHPKKVGSNAFVPAAAGVLMASIVVRALGGGL